MDPAIFTALQLLRATGLLVGAEVLEVVVAVVIVSIILNYIKKAR